jgi:hypothetical protein
MLCRVPCPHIAHHRSRCCAVLGTSAYETQGVLAHAPSAGRAGTRQHECCFCFLCVYMLQAVVRGASFMSLPYCLAICLCLLQRNMPDERHSSRVPQCMVLVNRVVAVNATRRVLCALLLLTSIACLQLQGASAPRCGVWSSGGESAHLCLHTGCAVCCVVERVIDDYDASLGNGLQRQLLHHCCCASCNVWSCSLRLSFAGTALWRTSTCVLHKAGAWLVHMRCRKRSPFSRCIELRCCVSQELCVHALAASAFDLPGWHLVRSARCVVADVVGVPAAGSPAGNTGT